MKSRIISTLAIATVTLSMILSGCNSPKVTESAATSSAAPTVTSAPVTIKLLQHGNQASNDAIKVLNQKFHEKYTYITVDESAIIETSQYAQVLQSRIAAGDVDLVEFTCFNITNPDWAKGLPANTSALYIDNGNILDLTGQPFVNNWAENTIKDSMTYKGKIYSVTSGKNAFNGIYYSKDIFAANGFKVPETWADFITICKALEAKGIAPMTGGGKDVWPIMMMFSGFIDAFEPDPAAFAKGLWTGERKYTDAGGLKDFARMAEFVAYFEKGVMSVDYASAIGRFTSGKAAMMPDGTWQGANITLADPNFKFGYFAIPGDVKGSIPPQMSGKYEFGFGAYANTKYKDEVLKWLDFFSQKDVYAEFVNACGFIPAMDVPVTNAFINELAPINQKFMNNYGNLDRAPAGMGKYGGFQMPQLKVLGGDIATSDELAALAQKDLETALAAIK